jgi:hypothetical protein
MRIRGVRTSNRNFKLFFADVEGFDELPSRLIGFFQL